MIRAFVVKVALRWAAREDHIDFSIGEAFQFTYERMKVISVNRFSRRFRYVVMDDGDNGDVFFLVRSVVEVILESYLITARGQINFESV